MIRLSITLLCLLFLVSGARAEIDFTPTVTRYYSQGAEFSSVSFKNDKHSISMAVPRKWTCRGDASRLQFSPPDQSFAEGVVQAAPPMRTRVFDEATVKALEALVINSVPSGSQGVMLISRLENPVILNQNLSYEFVVSYQTLGQTFHRSVIFVNCPEAQIIFRFTAPEAVFANLNGAFNRSVCSWYVTEPAEVTGAAMTASK
ncbi:MAG TPA: hypothetical protein VEX43_09445 [Chthoniobacterales bacterium]|nr:hypothetical protein [Chthoniobacterales bacterium]